MKLHISFLSGMVAIIAFILFTFTALALYPGDYTPISNWFSDLGNSSYNPHGSIFFNLGCIITGIMLFMFFIGLYKWYRNEKMEKIGNWRKVLLIIAQITGFFSAIALIMVGVYSEDYGAKHGLASALFFILLFLVLIMLNLPLLKHSKFLKPVGYFGFAVVIIDLLFIILNAVKTNLPVPLFEWLAVFAALFWLGALSFNMLKFEGQST